ncbi:MAG: glutamate 5-kinase [bacterium]|nr:glutamate 5-kinase [bacterium]
MREEYLKKVKRIVIKVGTRSLTRDLLVDKNKISKLVDGITGLYRKNYEILLVSSGAIASGIGELGLTKKPRDIPEKQASASVGQISLMSHYHDLFRKKHIRVGQVLLTESDLKDRVRYLNARNTLLTLIAKYKVVPVINENDVVGVEEIIFGDNDVLSALIANLVNADLLVMLTDTDGFYVQKDGKKCLLSDVREFSDDLADQAGGCGDEFSTGGMRSKLQAARIVTHAGGCAVIANSKEKNILARILSGEKIGTFFCGQEKALSHKKRWIAFSVVPMGKVFIDEGAGEALMKGNKSLLAGGITGVEGEFKQGDPVDICDAGGRVIGRGITNYAVNILDAIKGRRTAEIRKMLNEEFYEEVIHRDNLVIY